MSYPVAKIIKNGQDEDGTYYRRENGVEVCAVHFAGVPHRSAPLDAIVVERSMGGEMRGAATFKGGAPEALALSAVHRLPVLIHFWVRGRRPGYGELYTLSAVVDQIRPVAIEDEIGVTITLGVILATVGAA